MAFEKNQTKIEYGDFQTPENLAKQVCMLLSQLGCEPRTVLEPTCGVGHFLSAALQGFPSLTHLSGVEINPAYAETAKVGLATHAARRPKVIVDICVADFFAKEWETYLAKLPDPILIVGNPPWVTNAGIGAIDGNNLPQKRNSQNLSGLAALTGASNFDISEWMLLQILEWIEERSGTVAMLCKTSVARKVLLSIWKNHPAAAHSRFYTIDSQKVFGVSVDACLLVYDNRTDVTGQISDERSCYVYDTLVAAKPSAHIGYREGALVSDVDLFDRWRHLLTTPKVRQKYVWRSGIKHDASSVMELTKDEGGYTNRLNETASLEDDYLYPMLKSSDIARKLTRTPRFWMLVTQKQIGEETASIRLTAPKTWQYLKSHAALLDGRKSSIYRNRPQYSIFGVGEYTFSPWKVAISGMYKELRFQVIGEYDERPVVLDDTCYFLSCASQAEAEFIASLLNSEIAQQFYRAFIFWDEKRPITVRLLRKLNITALADEFGVGDQLAGFDSEMEKSHSQLRLLENPANYRA